MSSLMNCRRCGKMFAYAGKPICPDCLTQEEADFEKAREFIKENPGYTLQGVSDETGVSVKLLTKFLREGKIELSDGSNTYFTCSGCGAPIQSGRYCNNCLSKLGQEIMDAVPQKKAALSPAKKEKERMHISRLRND